MPKDNGLGYSKHTPNKQDALDRLLRMHMKVVRAIYQKYRWDKKPYRYFDITAGPGHHADAGDGSPVVFRRCARAIGLPYEADFIEQCDRWHSELSRQLHSDSRCHVRLGDHNEVLPRLLVERQPSIYGLLYVDPTGVDIPWALLGTFAGYYPKIDLLIHLAAGALKRARSVHNWPDLLCGISNAHKRYWLVQEPEGSSQWTFLFGTDWADVPEYKAIGLYRTDSDRGQAILRRLNSTEEEQCTAVQPFLFVPNL